MKCTNNSTDAGRSPCRHRNRVVHRAPQRAMIISNLELEGATQLSSFTLIMRAWASAMHSRFCNNKQHLKRNSNFLPLAKMLTSQFRHEVGTVFPSFSHAKEALPWSLHFALRHCRQQFFLARSWSRISFCTKCMSL